MADKPQATDSYFLIKGSDLLKQNPDFKLVGRDEELKELSGILLRKRANNVMLVGLGGSGASALCMGLQASKGKEGEVNTDTPLDIYNKRFYWLDTDGLFSSGNSTEINDNFKRIIGKLTREPDTVLVIDNMKTFIEGTRNSSTTNLMNSLMSAVEKGKFQAIFEMRDTDIDAVTKSHSATEDFFTTMQLPEPGPEALKAIVDIRAASLEKFHGIKIDSEAKATAIDLTNKYRVRDPSLSRAQPERALTLLDRSLTSYRQRAHARPVELDTLEGTLAAVNNALTNNIVIPDLVGKSRNELDQIKAATESDISQAKKEWEAKLLEIKGIIGQQRKATENIDSLEKEQEDAQAEMQERLKKKAEEDEKQQQQQPATPAPAEAEAKPKVKLDFNFLKKAAAAGLGATSVGDQLQPKIDNFKKELEINRTKFEKIRGEIDGKLLLTKDLVLNEFSDLSGIPVAKMTQNETEKLLNLEVTLGNRVYDQDEAVSALADAILTSKGGVKLHPNEPDAAFFLLGPSGTGKTELALAVAQALYDDEKNIIRLDMSEFSEKNAIAKLVGAPPGYEGFEQRGRLTTAVFNNPRSVVLFDEIEKADDTIVDPMLQVLSAGRLTDNYGRTSDFSQTVVIFTSNIGSKYFLDPSLTQEEAKAKALEDLKQKYRPEFLNRFAGGNNIICFKKLERPTIERIAERELKVLNQVVASKGVKLEMSKETIKDVVASFYEPERGARGISGYFSTKIAPVIAKTLLRTPGAKGTMVATFDAAAKKVVITPPGAAPANENKKIVSPATAFKIS